MADNPMMPMMQMPALKRDTSAQDMGMKILQTALGRQKDMRQQMQATPQPGQIMPGGATNIVPQGGFMAQQPMGLIGMLSGMFQRNGQGQPPAAAPAPMTSENAIF